MIDVTSVPYLSLQRKENSESGPLSTGDGLRYDYETIDTVYVCHSILFERKCLIFVVVSLCRCEVSESYLCLRFLEKHEFN